MTITNLFLFVPFIFAQFAIAIFSLKWFWEIGILFPFGFVPLIFIANAICGIVSSLQED